MKLNHQKVKSMLVEGFVYDRKTKTRVPALAVAELWVDTGSVITQLYGRALNSKRKQSVLAGGAVKVKVTKIALGKPKETVK